MTITESDIDSEHPLNIREATVSASDLALTNDLGKKNLQPVSFLLFNERDLAYQRADKLLREVSYPVLSLSVVCNAAAYKLEVGDFFKFSYDQYNISNKVFRVVSLKDSDIETPNITIEAVESLDYISTAIPDTETAQGNDADFVIKTIDALLMIDVHELNYHFADGENFRIIPTVGRQSGTETGFNVYYSIDEGESYAYLSNEKSFGFFGIATSEISVLDRVFNLTDTVSVRIINYENNQDVDTIEEITTDKMFTGWNLAIVGTEIFSYKNIEQSSGSTYTITGINRGLYGSVQEETWQNKTIRFMLQFPEAILNNSFYYGSQVYFKFVPYDLYGVGDLSEAYLYIYTFTGLALTPLKPHRLKADDFYGTGEWTTGNDIVFIWESSLQGYGAGIEGMSSELKEVSLEGLFKVEIYKGATLYRTVTGLTSATYTYADADIYSDFSSTYPDYFEARVYNYKLNADGNTYTSESETITLNKAL